MQKRKIGAFWITLCMVLACLLTPLCTNSVSAAAAPKLSRTSMAVYVGSKKTLTVKNTKAKVTWKSSKTKVATVSSKGVVKGVAPGTAKITATVSGKKLTCTVKIVDRNGNALDIKAEGTDGGDFVLGESKLGVSFKMDAATTNVKAQILDVSDQVLYTKTFPTCKKNAKQAFTWDGGNLDEETTCRIRITAGKNITYSEYFTVMTKASTGFAGGNGSKSNPYLVENLEQLKKIAECSNRSFKQTQDINGNYETFEAICGVDIGFTGSYDGGGHTISNLMIKDGIFAAVKEGAVVENLKFSDCTVTEGSGNCKGMNAFNKKCTAIGVVTPWNHGKIQNCSFKSCSISLSDNYNEWRYAGAVCGYQFATGEIRSCTVDTGNVAGIESYTMVGSIVGENNGKIIAATASSNTIAVTATNKGNKDQYAGGIAGKNTTSGVITNCKVSDGNVTVPTDGWYNYIAGGITGVNEGQILKCTAVTTVEGKENGTITGNKEGGVITN